MTGIIAPPVKAQAGSRYNLPRLPAAMLPLIEVSLNGSAQSGVIAYDIERGWIARARMDGDRLARENGRLAVDEIEGSVVAMWRKP